MPEGCERRRGSPRQRAGEVEITPAESVVRSRACAVHLLVIRLRCNRLSFAATALDGASPARPKCAIRPWAHA